MWGPPWDAGDDDPEWSWRNGYPHRREPDPEPEPSKSRERRYVCVRCNKEVLLATCKKVERLPPEDGMQETVRITYACPCAPVIRAARYRWDGEALRRLFGTSNFQLPWPVAMQEEHGGDAYAPPPSALSPKESYIARWIWELTMCNDAHDFLLFCRGPHTDI